MIRRMALTLIILQSGAGAMADEIRAPRPRRTIYPGDIIRAEMLDEAPIEWRESSDVARSSEDLIGRVAKRTLLAGQPIRISSTEDPQMIANGNPVQLVYERPGISISASGQALQSARAGDPIRVRNVESGNVVTGVVTPSGTVLVGR